MKFKTESAEKNTKEKTTPELVSVRSTIIRDGVHSQQAI